MIRNGFGQPGLGIGILAVHVVEDGGMQSFAGGHEAIAEVRVLVQFKLASTELQLVFVVTLGHLGRHASTWTSLKSGLEDNLGRATSEVEDGCGGSIVRASNLTQ